MKIFTTISILLIVIVLYFYTRPIEILTDLRIIRMLNGEHILTYRNDILGRISGLDSWYVQNSEVYGTLSSDAGVKYFYIDVCSGEKKITPYYINFHHFLNEKNIDKDRRNYMSGNNLINRQKFKYDAKIHCNQ